MVLMLMLMLAFLVARSLGCGRRNRRLLARRRVSRCRLVLVPLFKCESLIHAEVEFARGVLVLFEADPDVAVVLEMSSQELLGQRGLDLLPHDALDRPRAEDRVVAPPGEVAAGLLTHCQRNLPLPQALAQALQLKLHDPFDFAFGQRLEDNEVVHSVDELGPKVLVHRLHHLLLAPLPPLRPRLLSLIRQRGITRTKGGITCGHHDPLILIPFDVLENVLRADVRGHDDDAILEINQAALRVGDSPIIQHLEKQVEYLSVGFFHFVEEHHRVGTPSYGLSQLPSFLVANVTGRRTYQSRHRVLFHVFRHVDANQGVLRIEHELRECLGQLRLAHACWAHEEEGSRGPARVRQASPGTLNRIRHRLHGLVLPDDTLVQLISEHEELLPLALLEFVHRNSRPLADDVADVARAHFLPQHGRLLPLPSRGLLGHSPLRRFQIFLQAQQGAIFELSRTIQVVISLGLRNFDLNSVNVLLQCLH
mmetsp:Transcript_10351/g.25906  ORF Transcript_10351/g.25906 Transcript_10351/m.25906 type:complete len:480 (+) Transcript_10351:1440-2879(+)